MRMINTITLVLLWLLSDIIFCGVNDTNIINPSIVNHFDRMPADTIAKIISLTLTDSDASSPDQMIIPSRIAAWRSLNSRYLHAANLISSEHRLWKNKIRLACYGADAVENDLRINQLMKNNVITLHAVQKGDACYNAIMATIFPQEKSDIRPSTHTQAEIKGLYWLDKYPMQKQTQAFIDIFSITHPNLTALQIHAEQFMAALDFFDVQNGLCENPIDYGPAMQESLCNGLLNLPASSVRELMLNMGMIYAQCSHQVDFIGSLIGRLTELKSLQLINLPMAVDWSRKLLAALSFPTISATDDQIGDYTMSSSLLILNLLWNHPLNSDHLKSVAQIARSQQKSLQILGLAGVGSTLVFNGILQDSENIFIEDFPRLNTLVITDPVWESSLDPQVIKRISNAPQLQSIQLPPMHQADTRWWRLYGNSASGGNPKQFSFTARTTRQFRNVWLAGLSNSLCVEEFEMDPYYTHRPLWELHVSPSPAFVHFLEYGRQMIGYNARLSSILEPNFYESQRDIDDYAVHALGTVRHFSEMELTVRSLRKLISEILPQMTLLETLYLAVRPLPTIVFDALDRWDGTLIPSLLSTVTPQLQQFHLNILASPVPSDAIDVILDALKSLRPRITEGMQQRLKLLFIEFGPLNDLHDKSGQLQKFLDDEFIQRLLQASGLDQFKLVLNGQLTMEWHRNIVPK